VLKSNNNRNTRLSYWFIQIKKEISEAWVYHVCSLLTRRAIGKSHHCKSWIRATSRPSSHKSELEGRNLNFRETTEKEEELEIAASYLDAKPSDIFHSSNPTTKTPKMSSHPDSTGDPSDPFTSLLTLEDTLYTNAYASGTSAGSLAGRIEGRIFGLESGFDKFKALGELHGRSVVWGARILGDANVSQAKQLEVGKEEDESAESIVLPRLKPNSRLTNNTTLLHALTDPLTFSTDNTEDAVADFDDRVRRAGAKAKVIERIVGETATTTGGREGSRDGKEKKLDGASMEDFVAGGRVLR
jgi:hypothetical protein